MRKETQRSQSRWNYEVRLAMNLHYGWYGMCCRFSVSMSVEYIDGIYNQPATKKANESAC